MKVVVEGVPHLARPTEVRPLLPLVELVIVVEGRQSWIQKGERAGGRRTEACVVYERREKTTRLLSVTDAHLPD